MIQYIRDNDKQYDNAIKTHLRSHNEQFSNIHDGSSLTVYALEDNVLIGALTVSFFWDWVSIGHVYYKHREGLKHLIKKAWEHYQDNAVGIKLYTTVKTRLDDFVSVGFVLSKAIKLTENETYYYADLTSFNEPLKADYTLLVSDEPIEPYQTFLDEHTKAFKQANHIYDKSASFDMAALDGDICIGGVQCDVYGDMLYMSRLAVDPTYRTQSIGSILTQHAIEYAKKEHLEYVMLGTCEFQAKAFYEKQGFEIVFVREDNPKGYKSFTMIKRLK